MPESSGVKILIADDEPLYLRTTAELLRKAGYDCTCATDGDAALAALQRETFDLLLSDLSMPGNLKLELLQQGRDQWPDVPVIVVTGAPSLPTAIESVRLGISDYLLKPVKYDDLIASVRRALARRRRHEPVEAQPAVRERPDTPFPEIIGQSQAIRELCDLIERVAGTDANILITGESGTGKEVVACAIHRRSPRASGAFQVIDCTAIPESLFESILFGHIKGSFTGAVKDQVGQLSLADGGTAFFDEIGELPATLQAKLLRVIQEQTFTPVGRAASVEVDTRFICATNRNLELEVNAGKFRRDLFYRLAVIHIELPPLRHRRDDVLPLAHHFLHELAGPGQHATDFSTEAEELLLRYDWPGNIRELRNAVEHGLTMARSERVTPNDLPVQLAQPAHDGFAVERPRSLALSRSDAMVDAEREYLVGLLRQNEGNVAGSARQAGMSRQGLHKLLKKHNLDAGEFRT